MKYRKLIKKKARHSVREHYGIWVILCILMVLASGSRLLDFSMIVSDLQVEEQEHPENIILPAGFDGFAGISEQFTDILVHLGQGDRQRSLEMADQHVNEKVEQSEKDRNKILGRSQGILSQVVNHFTSGSFLISLTVGISSIVGSDSLAVSILIVAGLIFLFLLWVFTVNTYPVIMARMFLEGRNYPVVPVSRAFFLLKTKTWFQASATMLLKSIYETLWSLTVIGGVIKHYSYFLVPYLVAENPGLRPNQAITLSRRMMKGHKWDCFVLQLSFIGWHLLASLTFGIIRYLWVLPYEQAAFCEYYARIRSMTRYSRIPGTELLNDRYLYETAEEAMLSMAYGDVVREEEALNRQPVRLTGIRYLLADWFGLLIHNGKEEKAFEEEQIRRMIISHNKDVLNGKIYPARLNAWPEKEKRQWINRMNPLRCYSIWSLILTFFIMSFAGWLWEVSLHLIEDGVFVNRGVLHGPWLPIYGGGSVMILLLLYRWRRNPYLEFAWIVCVCGVVEYMTSFLLELAYNGRKWWDYSGYFLNLHGRICAEGLLVFGVGGLVIVYFLAPLLDNLVQRLAPRKMFLASLILIGIFLADQIWSFRSPNEGEGITSYEQTAGAEKENTGNLL